eukprot:m.1228371 g.1228371  ORF g.1228371 m.1228371 type:complete len:84 (-) comp24644_c0_seq9:5-256(-)
MPVVGTGHTVDVDMLVTLSLNERVDIHASGTEDYAWAMYVFAAVALVFLLLASVYIVFLPTSTDAGASPEDIRGRTWNHSRAL